RPEGRAAMHHRGHGREVPRDSRSMEPQVPAPARRRHALIVVAGRTVGVLSDRAVRQPCSLPYPGHAEVLDVSLLRSGRPGVTRERMAAKRVLAGTGTALVTMAALTSAMLPLRANLSIATTALILVVPVVIGVVIGGFVAGVVSVAAGFVVY